MMYAPCASITRVAFTFDKDLAGASRAIFPPADIGSGDYRAIQNNTVERRVEHCDACRWRIIENNEATAREDVSKR